MPKSKYMQVVDTATEDKGEIQRTTALSYALQTLSDSVKEGMFGPEDVVRVADLYYSYMVNREIPE